MLWSLSDDSGSLFSLLVQTSGEEGGCYTGLHTHIPTQVIICLHCDNFSNTGIQSLNVYFVFPIK